MKPRLYMIIPCYNEEKVLPITSEMFLEELNLLITKDKISENSRILFVNDGSKDKTLPILEKIAEEDKKVKVISFARNFGHQCAVTAGLKYVTGDAIVIIDADLQDPPELIPEMLKLWEEGNEVIYGKRKTRK